MSYLKIGKESKNYVVYRVIEYKGKKTLKGYYFSNNLLDCITYCKSSKYQLKGFIL